MSYIDGEQITRLKSRVEGLSPAMRRVAQAKILRRVVDAYGRMIIQSGLFQADPHPGNILIMKGKLWHMLSSLTFCQNGNLLLTSTRTLSQSEQDTTSLRNSSSSPYIAVAYQAESRCACACKFMFEAFSCLDSIYLKVFTLLCDCASHKAIAAASRAARRSCTVREPEGCGS